MINVPRVDDFYEWVSKDNGLIIVRFCAEWSGPCHIMEPIFKDLSSDYENLASFYEIDVDKVPHLQRELGIIEIPTLLFYRKGILIDFITGLISREALIEKLENAIKN